jgi:arsenite oxidase small subunit
MNNQASNFCYFWGSKHMPENKENNKSRSFTWKELEAFDGKEGHPFYVVFEGKIYDLSKSHLWIHGTHMGIHTRNENLAETIKDAPHNKEMLDRFPIIGKLVEQPIQKSASAITIEKKSTKMPAEQPAQPLAMGRRDFLKLAAAGGGAIAFLALASSMKALTFIPAATTQLSWPKITVANIKSLKLLTPITFNYPLTNTPNLLVKLGVAADGGVGPDKDIVAFSDICQHLGCFYGFVPPSGSPPCNKSYKASSSEGYCCCHGSQYDLVHGAKVIGGPAPRPLPQVQLEYDPSTGNINALSMGSPTIFGHGPPGTTDPALVLKYDLQGGEVVSGT